MINAIVCWRRLRENGESERMHKYERMKEDQKRGREKKKRKQCQRGREVEGECVRENEREIKRNFEINCQMHLQS